jgi:hypothetical protein
LASAELYLRDFRSEICVRSWAAVPADQIIRYPPVSNDSRYTFSLFAFPEDQYPATLGEFFQFSKDYLARTGYRTDLLDVEYRISQDQQALLSYSFDGPVMTIDPVSTGGPGWKDFLSAYNSRLSRRLPALPGRAQRQLPERACNRTPVRQRRISNYQAGRIAHFGIE